MVIESIPSQRAWDRTWEYIRNGFWGRNKLRHFFPEKRGKYTLPDGRLNYPRLIKDHYDILAPESNLMLLCMELNLSPKETHELIRIGLEKEGIFMEKYRTSPSRLFYQNRCERFGIEPY